MRTIQSNSVHIDLGRLSLNGILVMPPLPKGIVIFSHGSGSSHLSPRNSYIANELNSKNIGTLLFDLLTEEEDMHIKNRFDIGLLTARLLQTFEWVISQSRSNINVAFFGASTGAASALRAAAILGDKVKAVVSRGGRPDLTGSFFLRRLKAPTLFIVGGNDREVLDLNQKALEEIKCIKKLKIIPEAGHLFNEPGKLEQVALISTQWFDRFLNQTRNVS